MHFPLTAYIEAAMEAARYDKLEHGSFAGEIPKLKGVVAFGKTLRKCERELRSALENWILLGLRFDHPLPVLKGINLNLDDEEIQRRIRSIDAGTAKGRPFAEVLRDLDRKLKSSRA